MVSRTLSQPRGHPLVIHDLSRKQTAHIREALLSWFGENARSLPWRVPSVPFEANDYREYVHRLYRCLISETMLQQTQVKTVIAYYTKWLEKFPTIEDLACAAEQDVMACWAGLGYYSRAKRLHQAAQYLVKNFVSKGQEFPRDPEHWIKKVPGVGPYTAGAIISISFGIPSAIIDGNVQRVLSRVLAVHGDTSTPKSLGSKLLWQRAAELVDGPEPGNLNQALMELGATVCNPTNPSCKQCPISSECLAYKQSRTLRPTKKNFFSTKEDSLNQSLSSAEDGVDIEDLCTICPNTIDTTVMPDNPDLYIQTFYPFKPPKKQQREETALVIVVCRGEDFYVEKKSKGLLAGLYDFPTILLDSEHDDGDDNEAVLLKHQTKLGATLAGSTMHLFTHIRRTSHVLVCDYERAKKMVKSFEDANATGQWVRRDSVSEIGVSELFLKNFRLATGIDKPKKRIVSTSAHKSGRPTAKRKLTTTSSSSKEEEDLVVVVVPPKDQKTLCESTVSINKKPLAKPQSKFFAMFERKQNR